MFSFSGEKNGGLVLLQIKECNWEKSEEKISKNIIGNQNLIKTY